MNPEDAPELAYQAAGDLDAKSELNHPSSPQTMITKAELYAAQKACDDYTITEADVTRMDAAFDVAHDAMIADPDLPLKSTYHFTPEPLPSVSPSSADGILSASSGVSDLAPTSDLSAGGSSMPPAYVHPGVGVNLQDQCRSLIAHWGNVAKLYRQIGGVSAVARAEENEMHAIQLERLLK